MTIRLPGARFRTVVATLILLALLAQSTPACSADYVIWQIRSPTADPLYRFIRNGKAGFVDQYGIVVVPPQYDLLGNSRSEFENGLLRPNKFQSELADTFIDRWGKTVQFEQVDRVRDFSEGLAVARSKASGLLGYIDVHGDFVISPQFTESRGNYVTSFSDGMAQIVTGKKTGYLDRTGKVVIQPRFLLAEDFHEGRARVIATGPCFYVNTESMCPNYASLGENATENSEPCRFQFIDKAGAIRSEPVEDARDFSEGLAAVMRGDKWGYIDLNGKMVIPPQFDMADSFSDGLAQITIGRRVGYIDRHGAVVIKPQFAVGDRFADGLAPVAMKRSLLEEGDFYYIDKRGRPAFRQHFALASTFFKGLAHVLMKAPPGGPRGAYGMNDELRQYAYINPKGRIVFRYSYRESERF